MNKTARSTGFYILLGLLCIFLIFALRDSFNGRSDITEKELTSMLEKGQVSKVEIIQNEEVPTGTLNVTTTDNEILTVNVTDTTRAVELLSGYDVTVSIEDVSRRSTLFTMFIPVLLTGAMVLFLIMFMTRKRWWTGDGLPLYAIVYGIPRFIIEGLRSDSLYIGGTGIRVSQLLSAVLVLLGCGHFLYRYGIRRRHSA